MEKADFFELLRNPIITEPLPSDFNTEVEAEHLYDLYTRSDIKNYAFLRFVFSGGSGMVFQVKSERNGNVLALKVIRHAKYQNRTEEVDGIAHRLSPLSESELSALEKISHPNVVRLFDTIVDPEDHLIIIAIATTYVDNPENIDSYLRRILRSGRGPRDLAPFSPKRLDRACEFLLERFLEIANAIAHMHEKSIYHFDLKPANILISNPGRPDQVTAILTDMGSCIHTENVKPPFRVQFTWSYGHNDLTDLISEPTGFSGGGIKVTATVHSVDRIQKFDLFAFGRTIQELLAILYDEFGEISLVSYWFRCLHLLACLLLDEKNRASVSKVEHRNQKNFLNDVALNYPERFFFANKINFARELVEKIISSKQRISWIELAPELDQWQPNVINAVVHSPSPFTERVSDVLNHPGVRRLKNELQLGWIKEIYPGATHNRWSHILGTFSALVSFYRMLLSDAEVPTLKLLLTKDDVSNALIASLVHDLGQFTFGHDFEEAAPYLYSHTEIISRILGEDFGVEFTLGDLILRRWPGVNLERVLRILNFKNEHALPRNHEYYMDCIASDAIDGPIDADKLDYLIRDSIACGVPYGRGIDYERLLKSLTVSSVVSGAESKLCLAYKAKGAPAVISLLLARFQMFGAIYWHHTFRCMKAMLTHSVEETFGKLRGNLEKQNLLKEIFYQYVILKKEPFAIELIRGNRRTERIFLEQCPFSISTERSLEFIWRYSDGKIRKLINDLADRNLFKRMFEVHVGSLHDVEYHEIKNDLVAERRVQKANSMQVRLFSKINEIIRQRREEISTGRIFQGVVESTAREKLGNLERSGEQLIVIDFPTRGLPEEKNIPYEISDTLRKYFLLPGSELYEDKVFSDIKKLMQKSAAIRVFAQKDFHDLIKRYLSATDVRTIMREFFIGVQ